MGRTMRIRKDDQVVVIGGKDAGKTGRVTRTEPKKRPRLRREPQHGQAPRTPALGQRRLARRRGRRHRRKGGADPRLQRDAARPQRQQADPRRRAPRRGRQARAVREAQRGVVLMEATATQTQPAPPPRLRERYQRGGAALAGQEIQVLDADAGADADQDHPQHGGRRGASRTTKCSKPRRSSWRRSPASSPNVRRARKSIASFKVREGMPVGLSVTLRRARMWEFLDRLCSIAVPADPRLPRPQPALLRRPRQLLDGRQGAADLPRNRLRLDRRGPRSRHHDHDHGAVRPRGLRAAARRWACPSPRTAAPAAPTRRSSRKKKRRSAKRRPAPRPRPRQAALEQLKEENPEAYAKPEPEAEAGEEGEGDEGERTTTPRASPTRRIQTMAKTSQKVRQGRKPKFKTRGYSRCRRCGRPRAVYRKFGLCRICLREAAHEGYVPGMTKSSW